MALDTENHRVALAGSFEPESGRSATLWVPLGRDLGHILQAFVTVEPKQEIGREPTGEVELRSAQLAGPSP